MASDWSKEEVALIVQDYFNMLQEELQQQGYSKTEHRKALLPLLNNRSDGAIEFKHANISAVLAKMGLPYINGYKPRGNYQNLLAEAVENYLQVNQPVLEPTFKHFADTTPALLSKQPNFYTIITDAPVRSNTDDLLEEDEPAYKPIKINYLEREQNNRSLGEAGEKIVVDYERWRLINAGKASLADKIEWISRHKGDGAGYDILSKNEDGTDRFIEVKTTKQSKESPIFLSKTEIAFAAAHPDNFYLYRVYNFNTDPQIFIQVGPYNRYCRLESIVFKGTF